MATLDQAKDAKKGLWEYIQENKIGGVGSIGLSNMGEGNEWYLIVNAYKMKTLEEVPTEYEGVKIYPSYTGAVYALQTRNNRE